MFFCKILLKENKHSGQGVFKMMEKDIYTVYIYIFLNLLLCLGIPWDLWEIPLFCFYLLCLYRQCRHGLFSFRWRQAGLQSELAHVSTWRSPLSLHSTAHLFSSLWPTSPFSISAKNKATKKKKRNKTWKEEKCIGCAQDPWATFYCDPIKLSSLP